MNRVIDLVYDYDQLDDGISRNPLEYDEKYNRANWGYGQKDKGKNRGQDKLFNSYVNYLSKRDHIITPRQMKLLYQR